jgi:hypothetical protein
MQQRKTPTYVLAGRQTAFQIPVFSLRESENVNPQHVGDRFLMVTALSHTYLYYVK